LVETPEEPAAVMAREIGHVVHRDPLRTLIRQIGPSAAMAILRWGIDRDPRGSSGICQTSNTAVPFGIDWSRVKRMLPSDFD
tara:strand:+ start:306 stop:551 length:246 start_codon:yes stop_codon:yes gene_type:complete